MKGIRNIHVDSIDSRGQAAAVWETDEAMFHVWFDIGTKDIQKNYSTGKSTIYKNPLVEPKRPGYFDTRHLNAEKHGKTLKYVFDVINQDGLIAKATEVEKEKERKRQAESLEYERQERIKHAAMLLLAEVRAVAEGATRVDHCRALLNKLGE